MAPLLIRRTDTIDPRAPQGRFLKICNRFLADQKNMVFWHRTKTSKKADTIDPCPPHVRKRVQKVNCWPPFCIDFSTFSGMAKSHEIDDSFTLSMVLDNQKPFIFRLTFH
jgi:hypothetical protein